MRMTPFRTLLSLSHGVAVEQWELERFSTPGGQSAYAVIVKGEKVSAGITVVGAINRALAFLEQREPAPQLSDAPFAATV